LYYVQISEPSHERKKKVYGIPISTFAAVSAIRDIGYGNKTDDDNTKHSVLTV
jgi:hypothetical protein